MPAPTERKRTIFHPHFAISDVLSCDDALLKIPSTNHQDSLLERLIVFDGRLGKLDVRKKL